MAEKRESKSGETRATGWNPMPLSLKILFILVVYSSIASLFGLFTTPIIGMSLFGFVFTGILGVLFLLIMSGANAVLAVAMWKRYTWTFMYAVAFYVITGINAVLSIFTYPIILKNMSNMMPELLTGTDVATATAAMNSMYAVIIIFSLIVTGIFVWLFYRKRDYFR